MSALFYFMQCLNPILAFVSKNENGFSPIKFYNFKNFIKGESGFFSNDIHFKPYSNSDVIRLLNRDDVMLFPCRKCINCQLERSREWAIRNSLEAKNYEFKYFLTLTYENQPINDYGLPTLVLRDVQLFLKRLRKDLKQSFRYYLCGEYGGLNGRPHYHILMYGLKIDDLDYLFMNSNGDKFYRSQKIQDIWSHGIVSISEFSDYTAMYTARYCTKKIDDVSLRKDLKYKPEFNTMSRAGGIGLSYYNEHKKELYGDDVFYYHIDGKTYRLKPLKYFDRRYDLENPEHFKFIKENRAKFAKENNFFEKLETDLSFYEYLEMLERQAKDKIKLKRRGLCEGVK